MRSQEEIQDLLALYEQQNSERIDEMLALQEQIISGDLSSAEILTELVELQNATLYAHGVISTLQWVLNQKYAYDRRN